MAKNRKPRVEKADVGPVAALPDSVESSPIKPPGVVLNGSVGPPFEHGSSRLRSLIELSSKVDIEQVCDDAAGEIERLRASVVGGTEPWWQDALGTK